MELDLARLVIRHRHVAPMLSALLTGTNAGVRISDASGVVILEREGPGIGFEKFPIAAEGLTVGWVEGDRAARAIAAVLSYAVARETDKRSLAPEALERYRELNVVYQLADRLSGELDAEAVGRIVLAETAKLPAGGSGFVLVLDDEGVLNPVVRGPDRDGGPLIATPTDQGIVGAVARSGVAEEVNDVASDPRATTAERAFASLIVAPMVANGRTIGVVGAVSRSKVDYQAADLKLLSAIAAIAGPAVAQSHRRGGAAIPEASSVPVG